MLDPMEKLNYQSATYHALVSSLMSLSDRLCGERLFPRQHMRAVFDSCLSFLRVLQRLTLSIFTCGFTDMGAAVLSPLVCLQWSC